MKLQELARRSGTSVPSIKYYQREGLLPPGHRINATLTSYDDAHVTRLELIAALRTIVGLSIAQIKELIILLDGDEPLESLLGRTQAMAAGPAPNADPTESAALTRLAQRRNWGSRPQPTWGFLCAQVNAMTALEIEVSDEVLDAYASALEQVAAHDIASVASGSREHAVQITAVGTHSYSQLLVRILAVAQAVQATQRFGSDS